MRKFAAISILIFSAFMTFGQDDKNILEGTYKTQNHQGCCMGRLIINEDNFDIKIKTQLKDEEIKLTGKYIVNSDTLLLAYTDTIYMQYCLTTKYLIKITDSQVELYGTEKVEFCCKECRRLFHTR